MKTKKFKQALSRTYKWIVNPKTQQKAKVALIKTDRAMRGLNEGISDVFGIEGRRSPMPVHVIHIHHYVKTRRR